MCRRRYKDGKILTTHKINNRKDMILHEILSKYSFDTIFGELVDMMPDLNRKRHEMNEAYDFLLTQQPVASKKRITYQLIDAQDSGDCFVGAEDRCFEAQWNVITGKEVVVDNDIEITEMEIAANSFFCILLIGFYPRRFASLHNDLVEMMA